MARLEEDVVIPGAGARQEAALPGVGPLLLLALGPTQRPAAVPAPVHQPGQPPVAGQADGAGVVVRPHRAGTVGEYQLASLDVPGGYQQPPTPLLVQHAVVHDDQRSLCDNSVRLESCQLQLAAVKVTPSSQL